MTGKRVLLILSVVAWLSALGSAAFAQTNAADDGARVPAPVEISPPVVPQAFGDIASDVVFVPVAPCRIIDTRLAGGAILGGSTRDFRVTGTGFTGQGGSAGNCGVPVGEATAAFINFVAVGPAGPGDFRVTGFGAPMPLASFLNYSPGFNLANGVNVDICNPPAICTFDFTVQADVSGADLVADVMGYFKALPPAGRAWASVSVQLLPGPTVAFEAARTRNFTAVSRPATGIYCLTPAAGITLNNVPIMVTVEWGNSTGNDLLAFPRTPVPSAPCTGTDLQVRTYDFAGGGAPVLSDDIAFFVWVP